MKRALRAGAVRPSDPGAPLVAAARSRRAEASAVEDVEPAVDEAVDPVDDQIDEDELDPSDDDFDDDDAVEGPEELEADDELDAGDGTELVTDPGTPVDPSAAVAGDDGDDDEVEVTVPAVVTGEAAFDDEEDARVVAAVTGDDDEDEDDGIDGLRDGEFVCRSCYMAKLESQLADAERMYCRDCA
jgi:hypothetical protein